MEGVKWLENIAKQLNPAVSVEAAESLNTAFPSSLGRLCGERCPSRSRRAAAEEPGMKERIGMHPRVHKPGAIAQAKLVGTSPLTQFHRGFERNFYTASFSLTNPTPFISGDWHQPPVAPLGPDSSCMLFFAVNLSTLLPCPLSSSPPFKFFTDLMRSPPPPQPPHPPAIKQLFPEHSWLLQWNGLGRKVVPGWKLEEVVHELCTEIEKLWVVIAAVPAEKMSGSGIIFCVFYGQGIGQVPWYLSYSGVVQPTPTLCRIVIGSPVPLKCACAQCRKQ